MRKVVESPPIFEGAEKVSRYTTVSALQDVIARLPLLSPTRTERFALVKLALHFSSKVKKQADPFVDEEQSVQYFLEYLRPLVRKTDQVLLLHTTIYFLLRDADLQGARIVQERLWEALLWRIHTIEAPILPPTSISSGYSAYPEPCGDFALCITSTSLNVLQFGLSEAFKREQKSPQDLPSLSRRLGIPYLAVLPRDLPPEVRQALSPQLALELHCYPLGREQGVLTVALADPQSDQVLDRLHRETGMRIFPVLAHPHELQKVLDQFV